MAFQINICTSTGSRENNQNKVNTQLWDTLYVDGPVEAWILDIGYGLQIWRSNDTSSNIVSIRMFHAHQSVSSSSASSSKLMHDISRKLPAANHTEGEVSLSLGRHWDWLRLRKWYGVLQQAEEGEHLALQQLSMEWMQSNEWGKAWMVTDCNIEPCPFVIFQISLSLCREYEERHWYSSTSYPSLSTSASLVTGRVIPTAQPATEATRVLQFWHWSTLIYTIFG